MHFRERPEDRDQPASALRANLVFRNDIGKQLLCVPSNVLLERHSGFHRCEDEVHPF